MTTIPITIYALLVAFCFAKRNYWQFNENAVSQIGFSGDDANKLWHRWQGVLQILIFGYPALIAFTGWGQWQDAILGGAIFWLAFDGWLNKFLGKDLLYVGGGAIDGLFKKLGKSAGVIMLIVKIAFIAFSVILYNV